MKTRLTTPIGIVISTLLLMTSFKSYSQKLPVPVARTIKFTTTEGSNMNVDVSPDGKTIIFDLLGDIYSIPVTGGTAKQLTRGLGLHIKPAFSFNGKQIAYASDETGDMQLHIMNLNGEKDQMITAQNCKQIEFENTPTYTNGTTRIQLNVTNSEEKEDNDAKSQKKTRLDVDFFRDITNNSLVWSKDDNYIFCGHFIYSLTGGGISWEKAIRQPLRFSADGKYLYHLGNDKIYKRTLLTKIDEAITSFPDPDYQCSISPDGRWVTYVRDSSQKKCLIIKDILTNKERMLVPSLMIKHPYYQGYEWKLHYNFTSDSKYIFIGYGGKIHRIEAETGNDEIIPFTANIKVDEGAFNYNTYRVNNNDSFQVKYTRGANASPDGKHLVFTALNKIYIMDLPNGTPHVLVDQPFAQFQPVYSPDGNWVAYTTWCDTTGGHLWIVPAKGGKPEQLTKEAGQYQHSAWSTDGKSIITIKGDLDLKPWNYIMPEGTLEVINTETKEETAVDEKVAIWWNQISFFGDNKKVIYTKAPDFQTMLLSKNLNDNKIDTLAVMGEGAAPAKQISLSPDGRYIVYQAAEDLVLQPISDLLERQIIGDKEIALIRFATGVDAHWEKGGTILSWSYGNRFYRIDPDKVMNAAHDQMNSITLNNADQVNILNILDVKVKPDEAIQMNITAPSNYGHGTIALKNVRVITMQGNKVIEEGTLIIKNGRFVAVGDVNEVEIPAGAKVIDLTGKTIMPGLIDLHLHMHLPIDFCSEQSWKYLANLAYGVTTARDPSDIVDAFGYSELLRSGGMLGPRLFTVGRPVRLQDGVISLSTLNEARAIVAKRKLFDGRIVKQYNLPIRQQREWLAIACREANLNMTNEGGDEWIYDLGEIKDGSTGVEHNPVWGDVYSDITTLIAKSGTYMTTTLQVRPGAEIMKEYVNYEYWNHPDDKEKRFLPDNDEGNGIPHPDLPKDTVNKGYLYPTIINAAIRHAGGNITLGSHGENQGIGAHTELWDLQSGGLTNMEALQAGTILAAKALGMQYDLGSIEVGKIADLIILDKNPLDDIHNSREIKYVMKNGILYDGNTLDEIWPEQKKCPEWRLKYGK